MANRLTIHYEKKPCYDIVFAPDFGGLLEELRALRTGGRLLSRTATPQLSMETLSETFWRETVRR